MTKFVHTKKHPGCWLTHKHCQDDYRLQEGMKRTGYDADTGRYYFQDRAGTVWQGAEGAEFSEMTRGAPMS